MILSRTFARRRIAACYTPSGIAAWGLVVVDAILFFTIAGLSAPFIVGGLAESQGVWVYVALFAIYFIPMQGVLIISALWAAKSRWVDDAA
jgi:hypothetical protein|tara:strand:+ start:78 stop:350 length:273 start_codon:yes stop_codon:yes gene_type:complete